MSYLEQEAGEGLNRMQGWEAPLSGLAVYFQFQLFKHFLNICKTLYQPLKDGKDTEKVTDNSSLCLKSCMYSELCKHHFTCNYKTPSKKNKIIFGLSILLVHLSHATSP